MGTGLLTSSQIRTPGTLLQPMSFCLSCIQQNWGGGWRGCAPGSIMSRRWNIKSWHLVSFALLGFGRILDLLHFLSYFFPFGIRMSTLCLPTIVLCKHIMCLLHIFTARRGICLRMNHILSLAFIWFSWYLDETLDIDFWVDDMQEQKWGRWRGRMLWAECLYPPSNSYVET